MSHSGSVLIKLNKD